MANRRIITLRATDTLTRDRLIINENFKNLEDNINDIQNLLLSLNLNEQSADKDISFLLPSIDHVDGNALPPSENTDDVYILIDQGNGTVDPAWDGAIYNDWVQFNGIEWESITPKQGYYNHKNSTNTLYYFDGISWIDIFSLIVGSTPTKDDKELTPNTTIGNFQSTGITISNIPYGYIIVDINGQSVSVGDGVRSKDCYFSNDGGANAVSIDNITSGDTLYWNGTIAGLDLDGTDKVSLFYNTL